MARKNCKMTDEERAMHDRAVRLRKMTDRQLCETMDRQHSNGIDEGVRLAAEQAAAKQETREDDKHIVERFIAYLEGKVGSGNQIGRGTIMKLRNELSWAVDEGVIGGTANG